MHFFPLSPSYSLAWPQLRQCLLPQSWLQQNKSIGGPGTWGTWKALQPLLQLSQEQGKGASLWARALFLMLDTKPRLNLGHRQRQTKLHRCQDMHKAHVHVCLHSSLSTKNAFSCAFELLCGSTRSSISVGKKRAALPLSQGSLTSLFLIVVTFKRIPFPLLCAML